MLYNITLLKAHLARTPLYKENKSEIMEFFHMKNIFENLGVKHVYLNDKHPPLFIDGESLSKICLLADSKFGLPFKYKEFYEGNKTLISIPKGEDGTKVYSVSKFEDVVAAINEHSETSTYGIQENIKEQAKEAKKKVKVAALEDKLEAQRQVKREEFHRATNLNRDFVNDKIVSIDFEFKILKNGGYEVTELGIATGENGVIKTEHYLIKEFYENKRNRALQEKFDFGKTELISVNEIKGIIEKSLQGAKYVLFHEQREDFEILKSLKLDIEHTKNFDVVDTQLCYKRYFRAPGTNPDGAKLKDLLTEFKVKCENLHNAGNDANYTLQLVQKMSLIHKFTQENKKQNGNVSKKKQTRSI